MRMRVWAAIVLIGTGVAAAQSRPQTKTADPMAGMAMGQSGSTERGPSGSEEKKKESMTMGKMGGMAGMEECQMGGMAGRMRQPTLPTGPLKLVFGEKTAAWSVAALAALPHQNLTVCNARTGTMQTFGGVSLFTLLARLGAPEEPYGKDLRLYVVVEGTEGNAAVFSLAEINPHLRDAAALLADSVDGKPLGVDGPLQLVVPGEKRPVRWVRNLVRIRVLRAE